MRGSRYVSLALSFGWNLAVSVGVLGYGGYLLDKRWGSEPWLMISGILSGIVLGFKHLFTEIARHEGEGRRKEPEE